MEQKKAKGGKAEGKALTPAEAKKWAKPRQKPEARIKNSINKGIFFVKVHFFYKKLTVFRM